MHMYILNLEVNMNMDMGLSTTGTQMNMDGMASTTTMALDAMATSTMTGMAAPAKTSMSMSGMMGGCKISMLWNWYTVDACFIARSWRVSSEGIFALSCIGRSKENALDDMVDLIVPPGTWHSQVVLLVIALELVRRMQREYDRHIIRHAHLHSSQVAIVADAEAAASNQKLADDGSVNSPVKVAIGAFNTAPSRLARFLRPFSFRPSLVQQIVRGLLYMVQFAGAYVINFPISHTHGTFPLV
ncbi:Copper Transporter integral membrane protein that functions in high affinity copper transport [Drechslerella dactyloides]|uniref:Copper transport protein n=1 Tax=Drechslerella dactyloides TaxID=74499 RepID=A0AAD6IUV2_DREDA|nr:Copper Transporter integral membrane protein that functions in high affinity copper transport [Drechslerella dactyloides]